MRVNLMNSSRIRERLNWHSWRLTVVSLVFVLASLMLVVFYFRPTVGFVHRGAVIMNVIVAICCAICFYRIPSRLIFPKLIAFILFLLPLFLSFLSGCSTPPKLTAQDRRQDIEYMAHWVHEYSPFVELNEKQKGVPSYETLKPQYVKFAEEAETNEEFYLVVVAYFSMIGATGHANLFSEEDCKWNAIGKFLGIYDSGFSASQWWAGAYWPKLSSGISTRAHPPFFVVVKEGNYFTDNEWKRDDGEIPSGSQIVSVSGMTCSAYLEYVKTKTHLRYDAYPKDWLNKYLLFIDEGKDFRGWPVEFLLPNGNTVKTLVPKEVGIYIEKGTVFTTDAKENCTCLELSEEVGYIRIKSMMPSPLGYVFKGYIKRERKKIHEFLERSQGHYKKLIIDVRDNGGGYPDYVIESLIRPFLDKPITAEKIIGLKRKYIQDTNPSVLRDQKSMYSDYIRNTHEIEPPDGYDKNEWIFYQITQAIDPSPDRYDFFGKIYVLINGGCYSATDDYADLVKRTGLGVLVGQNTGGCGGGLLIPLAIRLPRSGMFFRLEADLAFTPEGEINELHGTEPDVKLPPAIPPMCITRDELLKHPWIDEIITKL